MWDNQRLHIGSADIDLSSRMLEWTINCYHNSAYETITYITLVSTSQLIMSKPKHMLVEGYRACATISLTLIQEGAYSTTLKWKPHDHHDKMYSVMYRYVPLCIVMYRYVPLCTVMYRYVLFCTVLYCYVLLCTAMYCYVLLCTAMYCYVLLCTAMYWYVPVCTVMYRYVPVHFMFYKHWIWGVGAECRIWPIDMTYKLWRCFL